MNQKALLEKFGFSDDEEDKQLGLTNEDQGTVTPGLAN